MKESFSLKRLCACSKWVFAPPNVWFTKILLIYRPRKFNINIKKKWWFGTCISNFNYGVILGIYQGGTSKFVATSSPIWLLRIFGGIWRLSLWPGRGWIRLEGWRHVEKRLVKHRSLGGFFGGNMATWILGKMLSVILSMARHPKVPQNI